jgi:hypothetical protein
VIDFAVTSFVRRDAGGAGVYASRQGRLLLFAACVGLSLAQTCLQHVFDSLALACFSSLFPPRLPMRFPVWLCVFCVGGKLLYHSLQYTCLYVGMAVLETV